ncbi:MAG: TatD family hydrolase [Actinomycetota bacterium]|nr:TatD family hydrolase [Actinomycetota bacterium]
MTLPPIDAHAHIKTSVPERDLSDREAFVVAVTRERSEWQRALRRRDGMAVWGIGVHPGLGTEIESFDPEGFALAVRAAVFVGEIGLDGRSKAPAVAQRAVFDQALAVLVRTPRPATIHSVAASRQTLDALQQRPIRAPVLHWWRGSKSETEEAIQLGCFFSVNGAEVKRPKVLRLLPKDRVLTETDFPYSRHSDPGASQPAAVSTTEQALMREWGLSELDLRRRLWRNLADLFDRCDLVERLPEAVQNTMLTAGVR